MISLVWAAERIDPIIFKQQRLKTGRQYSKALRISLNGALNSLHPPLAQFSLAIGDFSNWGPLEVGPQGKSPSAPALDGCVSRTFVRNGQLDV